MIEFAKKIDSQNDYMSLKAIFIDDEIDKQIIKEKNYISKFYKTKEAFIYLGSKSEYSNEDLFETIEIIAKQNEPGFNIYIESFSTPIVSKKTIIQIFTSRGIYAMHTLWNLKQTKTLNSKTIHLIGPEELLPTFIKSKIEAINTNLVRDIQITPHNHLNSVNFAEKIKDIFVDLPTISVSILTREEITAEKMGLFLGVNSGSAYEPRCVVIKYNGDAGSNQHLVMVGKGIMFDSGGTNLKPSQAMIGMKYDKSGAAIVLGAIKTIAELKYKTNVSAVLMLTDNMLSNKGSKPDDVYVASNNLSIEVNNTDAEGRLVLADGLVYAAKKLHATHLLDIATLTGAIKVALGDTYTGVWSTSDRQWQLIKDAASEANELVWRMPFHQDFAKNIKKSIVADLKNTDFSGKGGSISAAMFLKEFTSNLPYVHLDIAGTAKIEDTTTGIMVKTLANFSRNYF